MREGGASPNVTTGDGAARPPLRETTEGRINQFANVSCAGADQHVPSARSSIAATEKTGSVNQRMGRSELSAAASAFDVQGSTGTGKVWQAKLVFEWNERGCTSWLAAPLICVAIIGVAFALRHRESSRRDLPVKQDV
jgi:hypothetical protein